MEDRRGRLYPDGYCMQARARRPRDSRRDASPTDRGELRWTGQPGRMSLTQVSGRQGPQSGPGVHLLHSGGLVRVRIGRSARSAASACGRRARF